MKAAYYTGNQTFELRDIAQPEPAEGEVAIDVAWCGICGTDLHAFHGAMDARIGTDRIIGHEMSGTVAATDPGVTDWQPGTPVVVRPLAPCGTCPACAAGHAHICHNLKFLGLDTDGAFQQRWVVPAACVHALPEGMDLAHAALVEPVAVAVHDVRRARLKPGEDVLVIGGGPIGVLIATVAIHRGAKVTLSETNPHRRALAEALGLRTLDPSSQDVAQTMQTATGGKGADIVFEVSGAAAAVAAMTGALAVRGRAVMVAIHTKPAEIDLFRFFWREIELIGARTYEPRDYDEAIRLVAEGVIDTARFITDRETLPRIGAAFESLSASPNALKTLIDVKGM